MASEGKERERALGALLRRRRSGGHLLGSQKCAASERAPKSDIAPQTPQPTTTGRPKGVCAQHVSALSQCSCGAIECRAHINAAPVAYNILHCIDQLSAHKLCWRLARSSERALAPRERAGKALVPRAQLEILQRPKKGRAARRLLRRRRRHSCGLLVADVGAVFVFVDGICARSPAQTAAPAPQPNGRGAAAPPHVQSLTSTNGVRARNSEHEAILHENENGARPSAAMTTTCDLDNK